MLTDREVGGDMFRFTGPVSWGPELVGDICEVFLYLGTLCDQLAASVPWEVGVGGNLSEVFL